MAKTWGPPNTVSYSAGRICYPNFVDAVRGLVRCAPEAVYDAWWPGQEAR
jgi:hypothetical protein